MKPSLPTTRLLAAAIALFMLIATASAQTYTWVSSGPLNSWEFSLNWSPTGIPGGINDEVVFGPLADNLEVDNVFSNVIGTMTFDDSRDYTIFGQPLTLNVSSGSAAITVNNSNGNGAHTINTNLSLADNLVITNHSTGTFTTGGVISGSNGVTKSGAGNVTFTGDNTYSGGTTINAGTLQVGNGGTTGSISGDVTNNGTLTFNRSDDVTFSNVISGTGGMTKEGSGMLTLSGENTHSGITFINDGVLRLGNSLALQHSTVSINTIGGLDVNGLDATLGGLAGNRNLNLGATTLTIGNNNEDSDYSGDISGTGNLIKIGTGDLELNGDNTYSGTTTISVGRLTIGDNNLNSLANSAATVNAGATLRLEDVDENDAVSIGSLAGAGTFLTNGAGAKIGRNNTSTTFSGSLEQNGDDDTVVEKVGTGTWTLTGSMDDLFELRVSEGDLVLDGVSGSVEDFRVEDLGHLTIQNTNALSPERLIISDGGTVLITGSATDLNFQTSLRNRDALTIADGASVSIKEFNQSNSLDTTIVDEASLTIERFDSSRRNGTIAISDASGGTALTVGDSIDTGFEGVIEDYSTGPGSVLKTGSGTITFFGANTYSGTTTIEEGALRIGNSLALLNTTVSIGVDNGLDVNDIDATLGGLAGSGNLNFDTTTLSVGNNNADTTYSGALNGTGTFTKIGSGTLTLTGSGHALSELDVNGGGLIIDGASGSFDAIEAAFGQEITIQNTTSAFEATSLTTVLTSTMTLHNAQVLGVSSFDSRGTLTLENGSALSVAAFGQGGSGQTIVDQSSLSIGSFGPLINGSIALSDPS
ncbi:MAG: autotransporter-associated beta strand repeat-containing protein, partial [Verrucomicrobiota bacterium]